MKLVYIPVPVSFKCSFSPIKNVATLQSHIVFFSPPWVNCIISPSSKFHQWYQDGFFTLTLRQNSQILHVRLLNAGGCFLFLEVLGSKPFLTTLEQTFGSHIPQKSLGCSKSCGGIERPNTTKSISPWKEARSQEERIVFQLQFFTVFAVGLRV